MSCSSRRLLAAIAGLTLVGARAVPAQNMPYYGKNKVHYDQLGWRVYETVHFRVYYYPEFEEHLGRSVSYLESGYQTISSGLKHELTRPIPAILYKTHSEFEQTNLFPDFMPEGVLAFAEPTRGRLLLPIDEPPDQLQGLITHELTHVFAFDMIPRAMFQPAVPLWIDEGLADYFRATWNPLDVMMLRDAAVTERVPSLSRSDFQPLSGRLVYNMGHAAFEFIEGRWGKEGVRQFLFNVRKGVLGSGVQGTAGRDELYQRSFRISPEEFDQAFDTWLKDRFKPYRDRQRPSDFGTDITPAPEKTAFAQAYAAAASPSGEILAVLTQRASEGELALVLLSARDGSIVRNLTPGFASQQEGISLSERFIAGRSISFAPQGDVVAFFARQGKRLSLIHI